VVLRARAAAGCGSVMCHSFQISRILLGIADGPRVSCGPSSTHHTTRFAQRRSPVGSEWEVSSGWGRFADRGGDLELKFNVQLEFTLRDSGISGTMVGPGQLKPAA